MTKVSESPIKSVNEDCFDADLRIVSPIFEFIKSPAVGSFTLAIRGTWGSGKSSVINLLKEKIAAETSEEYSNIVITFEPLLEGRCEISDIIELFYLKLYQGLILKNARKKDKNQAVKETFKKILKSLALLCRSKISGGLKL